MAKWDWEGVDPMRSMASGDFAKMFKNEDVKEPGPFAVDPPQVDASVLAREVIQNSWDAAQELQSTDPDAPDFSIDFKFRTEEKRGRGNLATVLGLKELADRSSRVGRVSLGLSEDDCLVDLAKPIRTLEISESATTGMYGPFVGTKSKLYLALVGLGFTLKAEGAGGSFGYGKAGLIRGSKTRTVVAYTCFKERDDDPGITRRLLGMTYWGPHENRGSDHTGFARYGDHRANGVFPFENEAADSIARSLGLAVRSSDELSQLGTSFLLLDPSVSADAIRIAVERNWWPALIDRRMTVDIVGYDDEREVPRPRKNEALRPFIRGYELATVKQDSASATERSRKLRPFDTPPTPLETGSVGLVANPTGWSYPSEETTATHQSLVALVRGPRMVVEYWPCGRSAPFVRGTFVSAAGPADDLLRQTEPKLHDSWDTHESTEAVDPRAPRLAADVLRKIRLHVDDFRRSLRPVIARPENLRLPEFEGLMKGLFDGSVTAPRDADIERRAIEVRIDEQALERQANGLIRLIGKVSFKLGDELEAKKARVRVAIRFAFAEDGRTGIDLCPLDVRTPDGFVSVGPALWEGDLGRRNASFAFKSEPYDSDWTGHLNASAELAASTNE